MTKFEPDGHALKTLIWDYEKVTLAHLLQVYSAQHDVTYPTSRQRSGRGRGPQKDSLSPFRDKPSALVCNFMHIHILTDWIWLTQI